MTKCESALNRWTVGGPELARLLNEYDEKYSADAKSQETHHEQVPSVQKIVFCLMFKVLLIYIQDICNPFSEISRPTH